MSQFSTYHLQVGDPVFPPQILLEFWSHGGQHVVEVHDNVHKWVDDANESSVSTWVILGTSPRNHRHDSVVIQMQERHLIVLLSKHKENCVKQFRELGDEVHVAATCFLSTESRKKEKFCELVARTFAFQSCSVTHSHSEFICRSIHRLAPPAVVPKPSSVHALFNKNQFASLDVCFFEARDTHLGEEINTDQHLYEVVRDQCVFELEWFAIFHKARSPWVNEVKIQ